MTWTTEQKIGVFLRQPWSIRVQQEDDDRTVTIDELPEFIMVFSVTEPEKAAEKEFWSALRTTLRSYLEHDEHVPRPRADSGPLPWEAGSSPLRLHRRVVLRLKQNGARPVVEEVEEAVSGAR